MDQATDARQLTGTYKFLAAVVILGGLALRLWIAPSYGYLGVEGDIIEQKQAVHRAITLGFHEIYTANPVNDPAITGVEWQGGYFVNYPPVIYYLRYLPGLAYRYAEPEAFESWNSELNFIELEKTDLGPRLAASRGFTVMVKLPGIVADTLLSLGLLLFVCARAGPFAGLAASAAYAFNPGMIFNTAHWGQADGVWVLFLAASLFLAHRGRLELSWTIYALAALTKPQPAAFALLVLFLGPTTAPLRRNVYAGLAALGTALLVFFPFIVHGTFVVSVVSIFRSLIGGEPVVSANAANFWWFATAGRGYEVADTMRLIGPLSARHLGLAIFLAANLFAFWRLRRAPAAGAGRLYLAAAFIAMSFFTFNTELHENHMMAVVPLIAFALPEDRRLWGLLGLLSVTFLMNVVLFDPAAIGPVMGWLGIRVSVQPLSVAVAFINIVAFGFLAWIFWLKTGVQHAHVSADE